MAKSDDIERKIREIEREIERRDIEKYDRRQASDDDTNRKIEDLRDKLDGKDEKD